MAAKTTPNIEPCSHFQLIGYTLRCWPQSHFYSSNLIDILKEYQVPAPEAKKALGQLRARGYLEYLHRPPGLWRIRKPARSIKVPPGHQQIYDALAAATQANIDARLADTSPPEAAPTFKGIHYRQLVAAALQIWPANHFEELELRAYCERFAHTSTYASQRARSTFHHKMVAEGRLWFSEVHPRLGRITPRGRMAPLGPRGPEILATMRALPPEAGPAWQDYVNAFALDHPGEWAVARLLYWLRAKLEQVPARATIMHYLQGLEGRHLVELMARGNRHQSTRFRTRPALFEAAAADLTLYEQLLHPDGGELAGRCYPKGRPEDLLQVGKVAPELADDTTVAAMALPAEQGLEKSTAPGTAQVVTLQGVPVSLGASNEAPVPTGGVELSGTDLMAALVDYINELRAGAGVTEVARLRQQVDNLSGALRAAKSEASGRKRAVNQLNSIKAQLEEQIKDLSSQLAAANNRLEQAKRSKRPAVHTRLDKGRSFGLGEVATFKGRPLSLGDGPIVEKKRARG